MTLPAAADLHVHSRFSNRPTEWLLARMGAPESFTDPLVVYRRCRERGMTHVTLTDHDTIAGALEIAHLPGVFLSCEATVRFPEDGCTIHCLAFGIDETQHDEIQRRRDDVYALRDYLYDENIAYSIAHPLFRVDDRLTVEHFEKLLVLFKCFEGLNGAHDPRSSSVTRAILNNVSPRQIEELANRHDLDPRDPEPWRKFMTAGSDDHSGLYVASAWSSAPLSPGAGCAQFLAALRGGDLTLDGSAGSSVKLGRSVHSIAARYLRAPGRSDRAARVLACLSDSIVRARIPAPADLDRDAGDLAAGTRHPFAPFVEEAIRAVPVPAASGATSIEGDAYGLAGRITQRLAIEGSWRAAAALRDGKLGDALDCLHALLPAALSIAPYLVAYQTLHKDEPLVRAVAERFPAAELLRERSGRTAWFRDAPMPARPEHLSLEVLAVSVAGSTDKLDILDLEGSAGEPLYAGTRRFAPLADLRSVSPSLPSISIPPVLDLLEHCERERFDRVLITSPGPMAAAARCVAGALSLDLHAIVDPDSFEALAGVLCELVPESAVSAYLRWLYLPAVEILTVDPRTRGSLERWGVAVERLRAVDLAACELDVYSVAS